MQRDIRSKSRRFVRRRSSREGAAPGAGEPGSLSSYFHDIGSTPTLTRAQEQDLARGLEEHRRRRRDLLLGVPWLADFVAQRAQGLREAGRLPITLSALPPYERNAAARRAFEGHLAQLERLAARRRRHRSGAKRVKAGTRERLQREIRRCLRSAGLAPEVLDEAEQALRALRDEFARRRERGDRAGARVLEREIGLPARDFQERMAAVGREAEAATALRNRFARHNLKLVISMARQFQGMNVALSDLIQEANLGLLRAVEKFDHRRGTKFSTYAAWWIRQSLVRSVQKHSRDVRVPSHVFEAATRRERARAPLSHALGRPPTSAELASEARLDGTSQTQLERLRREVSLDAPVAADAGISLGECIADPEARGAGDEVDRERLAPAVRSLLPELEAREQSILERRFGLGNEEPKTLQEVGRSLGISRERARQLQAKALEGLRRVASQRGLEGFLEPSGGRGGRALENA